MKKGIYSMMVLAGMMLAGAQGAYAGVTVNYKLTSPQGVSLQTIQYRDQQHVRLNMRNGRDGPLVSMIRRGDKVYAVTPEGEVIEMTGEMGKLGASLGGLFGGGGSGRNETAGMKFEDTGRSERVAGIRGEVYRYTGNGEVHEVVLTRDRNLADVFQAWIEMNKLIARRSASDRMLEQMQQNTPQRDTGFLRFDRSMVLVSMKTGKIPDSAFELPGKAMRIPSSGSTAPSRYKSRRAEQSKRSESVVEKDAKDIGRNSVNEAHQSTKQGIQNGISDQIQKGIGGLMNGLFGR